MGAPQREVLEGVMGVEVQRQLAQAQLIQLLSEPIHLRRLQSQMLASTHIAPPF